MCISFTQLFLWSGFSSFFCLILFFFAHSHYSIIGSQLDQDPSWDERWSLLLIIRGISCQWKLTLAPPQCRWSMVESRSFLSGECHCMLPSYVRVRAFMCMQETLCLNHTCILNSLIVIFSSSVHSNSMHPGQSLKEFLFCLFFSSSADKTRVCQ